MKQHLRKLSALLLTLVLAISLAPAALAVTPVNDTTITFGNVESGDIVKAYPMVTYDATYSSLVYHPAFQAFLEGKKGGAAGTLDEWFKNVGVDNLNKYLVEYTSKALAAGTATGYSLPTAGVVTGTAAGTSVALALKTGYYLILVQTTEDNGKIYRPISIFLRVRPGSADAEVFANGNTTALTPDPATGYTINMKSEAAPVIAKKTRKYTDGNKWESNISASVGNSDPVEFYVEVKVPVYQGDPDLELTLNDTLQYMAVTFEDTAPYTGLAVGTGIDSTYGVLTGTMTDAVTGVTVNPYNATAGTQEIQIKLDYSKLKNTTGGTYTVFYVHYYAILQKEAVENDTAFGTSGFEKINAGKNSATLTYVSSADPANPKTTAPVSAPVYTYSVKLDKQKVDGTDLARAKFRLYRNAAMTDTDEVVLAKDAAGFYYPADHGATRVEIDTDTGSSFRIKGLDQGTYYLKETATASGYFLPKNGFKIVLTGEDNATDPSDPRVLNGKLAAASTFTAIDAAADSTLVGSATVDTTAVNQLDIVLKNSSQPILPSTGGMGTALFTFGGVALMVLAAGLTIYMRKRKEN